MSCGGQDGPDWAGINRTVRVAASPLIDRADVEAGTAPNAVERIPTVCIGQYGGPAVIEQDQMESCGPSPGVTPVHIEVYGFMRSPVEDLGQQLQKDLEIPPAGTSFSIPMIVIKVSRRETHPTIAFGFHDPSVPVSAIPKFAPLMATLAERNLRRRC